MSANLAPGASNATILVVDDEPYVRGMVVRWLATSGYRTLEAANYTDAIRAIKEHDVHLVTLDITMPGGSGLDLLVTLRDSHPDLPVLMLTASGHINTAIEAMAAGAIAYLIKPIQQEELLVQVVQGLQWRQLWIDRRRYTESLEQKVVEQTQVIRQAHEETIHRLVSAAMCRDEETGAHILRTGLFSEALARAIGWSRAESEMLRLAAPMHDIGKIGIPDAILQKRGPLTDDEYDIMKTHTTIGAQILLGSQTPVLQLAHEVALYHHERWDGNGYPFRLVSDAIPVAARILSIVDVYDALTHDRVYRPAFSEERALAMMQEQQGTQFDPLLLTAFFNILEEIHEIATSHPDEHPVLHGSPVPATSVACTGSMESAKVTS